MQSAADPRWHVALNLRKGQVHGARWYRDGGCDDRQEGRQGPQDNQHRRQEINQAQRASPSGVALAILTDADRLSASFADRAVLGPDLAALATRRSYRESPRVTRQNAASAALCLWWYGPPSGQPALEHFSIRL